MEDRQNNLLRYIIEEHIKTALPVSSSLIAEKHFPDLSSATIRNEMAELEDLGYIVQPHTSAGRIPTAAGYREFIGLFIPSDATAGFKDKKILDGIRIDSRSETSIKSLAKAVADICDCAVVAAFSANDLYYTGISHLFRQPEFAAAGWAYSIGEIIDSLEKVLSKIYFIAPSMPQILIGDENPFGDSIASITVKCEFNRREMLWLVLGPMRFDYQRVLGVINHIREKINNLG